jgi:hypothetical protein
VDFLDDDESDRSACTADLAGNAGKTSTEVGGEFADVTKLKREVVRHEGIDIVW